MLELVRAIEDKKARLEVWRKAKEIAHENKRELEEIASTLLSGGGISQEEMELGMKALIIDPQYLYYRGIKVVTPIGYFLTMGYDVDLLYLPPGTQILTGERLFFHPIVRDYFDYLFSYLLERMGPGEIALFTPCSKVKPYRDSFMYKKIESIINKYGRDVWRFVVSEPLVIVPRFMDVYFPAAHYDYPPEKVTKEEREVYVNNLRKSIEILATNFEKMIYTLPRKHKAIFEEALEMAQVPAHYTPYNVYYFPSLKQALINV